MAHWHNVWSVHQWSGKIGVQIQGWVIPKTQEIVLDASLFNPSAVAIETKVFGLLLTMVGQLTTTSSK